jgi:hypothetical protein
MAGTRSIFSEVNHQSRKIAGTTIPFEELRRRTSVMAGTRSIFDEFNHQSQEIAGTAIPFGGL